VATLAIYSFLIKENRFYRFFEHLFIGIAAGFLPIYTIKSFFWPQVLEPMLGYNISVYLDGTPTGEYETKILFYILPMLFGLLYYFIYSTRYSWLSKLVIGFSLGYSGGLAFKGFFAQMMPQLTSSFKPLVVLKDSKIDWAMSTQNFFFVFTLLAVMYYFFFTFRKKGVAGDGVATSGRWLMMVCFGAFFGSTVMARMALLVERLQFLLHDWWNELSGII
ncbi:MAG: hypothetical protein KDD55_03940, partial [Bdellovibrionales bacterium]|nr:hypothetical protein [Bdellovibrionales bacterium]